MTPNNIEDLDVVLSDLKFKRIVEHFKADDKKRTGLSLIGDEFEFILGSEADSYVNRRLRYRVDRVVWSAL